MKDFPEICDRLLAVTDEYVIPTILYHYDSNVISLVWEEAFSDFFLLLGRLLDIPLSFEKKKAFGRKLSSYPSSLAKLQSKANS